MAGTALTFGCAGAGGWAASRLGVPAPWLVGSVLVTFAASVLGLPLRFPAPLQALVIAVIGINVGGALDPHAFPGVAQWLPSFAGLLVSLGLSLVFVAQLLQRQARFPPLTAFFAAYPGHLVAVIQAAIRADADVRAVTVTQSLRVLVLVAALPSALGSLAGAGEALPRGPTDWAALPAVLGASGAGILLGSLARVPAAFLIGSMLGATIASLAGASLGTLPEGLNDAVLGVTGAMIGTRFAGVRSRSVLRMLPTSLAAVALALVLAALCAGAVSLVSGLPFAQLLLAYAPGGADAMAMIAVAIGHDPAFVGLHHVLRLMCMALALPYLISRLADR